MITSAGTVGSVQTITFNEAIPEDSITCGDILVDPSEGKLGRGAVCKISSSTSLRISYGHFSYSKESQARNNSIPLQLKGAGFGSCIFTREIPSFFLSSYVDYSSCGSFSSSKSNKYEDSVIAWSIVNITGNGILTYIWSYGPESGTGGPPLPLGNSTSYDFKFWRATVGETYSLMVTLQEEGKEDFSYSHTTHPFTVLSSCSTPGTCQQVVWTFSCDPGPIQVICTDSLFRMCSKSTIMDPMNNRRYLYLISTFYDVGSLGGPLKLDHKAFDNPTQNIKDFADAVSCGRSIIFPSVAVEKDASLTQSSKSVFNISGHVTERGKTISTDYLLEWEATNKGNISLCTTDSSTPICTFPPNSFTFGVSYTYTLKLFLTCQTRTVWDSVAFSTFTYAEITSSPTIPLLPINSGIIEIEPTSGIAFQTEFEITAKEWVDSTNENAELYFRFGYQIKNEPIMYLNTWNPNSQWKGTLPSGGIFDPLGIIVSARNKLNVTTNLTQEILVLQPSFKNEDQKNIYINNLLAEVEKDQPMEKLKSLLKLKSLFKVDEELEDTENECGGCGQHGSCNPLNHGCICEDGWKANPQCTLSNETAQNLGNNTLQFAQGTSIYIYIYIYSFGFIAR